MQGMHRFHDGVRVLPSDEGAGSQVRVLQALGKLIQVHFAVGVARHGNTAAGMEQGCKEQVVFA
ncbi:hypothetical protein D9M69_637140 [compost metagenome]